MFDFKKIIYFPYYYVPPCPRCQSLKTGRYIKAHRDVSNEWVYLDALKHGEYVVEIPEILDENAFCMDCGFAWPENISLKFYNLEQIKKEKEQRETYKLLSYEYELLKEQRKEERKKGGIIRLFTRFIGKI